MPRFDLPESELRSYAPEVREPEDFDEFWAGTLAEARGAGTRVDVSPVETPLTSVDAFDVTFPGYGGEPVRAWLMVPAGAAGPLPAVVEYLGYGGGRGLPVDHLEWASSGYAHLVMDTRGQGGNWGSGGDTADPHGTGPSSRGFMTRGIEDPADYYFRRLVTDAVRAVDAVRTLDVVDAGRVAVCGNSQGGGLTIAAAALSEGLVAAMPNVPFLCHFGRAVGLTDEDPYAEIVRYLAVNRGEDERVFRTLSYFDGVNMAKRATPPALFSTALLDQTCPPSTVFAAFNRWAGPDREIRVYSFNQHEGGESYQWVEQAAFLAARV